MKRLAVAVSGKSTLLEAMIADRLKISLVLADRQCRGLQLAENAGISSKLIRRTSFGADFNREAYTREVGVALDDYEIDFMAMAGFMTVLHPIIFTQKKGRILNSHPSLLPAFKGEVAVAEALKFGVKVTGTTIHIATEELDEGPILAQEPVRVLPGDTVDTLWERIKVVERKLYPVTIREFAETI